MATDYAAIRAENIRRYGTDIGRIGPMLLANRYDDRTHFIYELLQNAEDAFARGGPGTKRRSISFRLSRAMLRISHFGAPFTEKDVRGICGIAESTKGDLTAIGRFGIGFKSVYAFTDRPQIHSGDEHFAIEKFVWPAPINPCQREPSETVFVLPLGDNDSEAIVEITGGLKNLGPRALLFLREIEEISWSIEGGPSGVYLRSKPEPVRENARRIIVIGQEQGAKDVTEETWLVFSRPIQTDAGRTAGYVEVAFSLVKNSVAQTTSVMAVGDSPLVAFFPTVLSTNLGFLVQGPYRTTPSRDNIPRQDPWNQKLVEETASLIVEALRSLRDMSLLNTDALQTLPLDRGKFEDGQMFSPIFDSVLEALSAESLLPELNGSHVSAKQAKLGRTQELRDLVSPKQLGNLFGESGEIFWLSQDITQDRTPELRQYLLHELGVAELTPELLLPKLTSTFLEKQTDDWILRLYEFLHGQPALLRQGRVSEIQLIRLEDGTHVLPIKGNQPQAFLPGSVPTQFPTVRRAVCRTNAAKAFLTALGLTEPDPVDDVVWNILPKYVQDELDVSDETYAADVQRILTAFGTDSKLQREKLLDGLRNASWVMSVDTGNDSKWRSKPGDVYLATQRLKDLFNGVSEVFLVDEEYECLRGEAVRELLEACGATRYLQPVHIESAFNWEELAEMRRSAGFSTSTGGDTIEDYSLRGLDQVLAILPSLNAERAILKSTLLWEALCDIEDRRGTRAFLGNYRWYYFQRRSWDFDAAFVRHLNTAEWVPDKNSVLQRPEFVLFEETGWKTNPFVQSKIRFKPPIIETLAKEAGIEPGVLDLLKKLGVTSEAELKSRLGIDKEPPQPESQSRSVDDAVKNILGTNSSQPTPPVPEASEPEFGGPGTGGPGSSAHHSGVGTGSYTGSGSSSQSTGAGSDSGGHKSPASHSASADRHFISYLGVQPTDEEPDPDGLDHQARLALEEQGIAFVLSIESDLQRTSTNNPGYDLVATNENGSPAKWVEVKAMKGTLHDRPVGMSSSQFKCAREHGSSYWLYIVEHAGTSDQARLFRIQDPAGRARTFTFDHGWISIAEPRDQSTEAAEITADGKN